ncbi:hypothetical protein FO440_11935 [Mucilaginibacter corticis]|uniref:DUF6438 domain-containing protein n=1 Tax=Mucilaginibacter corticis TaxID=2597670 RepID=A0A556MKW5_9SPHI|nr:DUF6438 domain-containing protein [Mucilaginibacter corticis]TSJ40459.1 hypothetical protein FO440_11935 [Mucilaginibacter corticis]
MKKLLTLFSLLFTATISFANKVDDLKTDSDIVKFIQPLQENFNYKDAPKLIMLSSEELVKRHSCDSLAGTWHIKNWEKADFNNDHKTDLLAIINWYDTDCDFIAIDKGDNTFQLIQIGGSSYQNCQLANTIKYAGQQMVELHTWASTRPGRKNAKWISRTDTLTYKYGDFLEFNKEPAHYKIDSIIYKTQPCFGTCPVFKIEIDHNGKAKYDRTSPNIVYILKPGEKIQNVFNMEIKKPELEELYHLIEYINIKKLNENYAVRWSDDATAIIYIKFSDGSVKTIKDYGLKGTFGLFTLYKKIYALTKSPDWK